MTFEDLGAMLRSEREKRNLAINDVADKLKISPRLLQSIEAGDIDSLPHPAYARGFIRSYASFLGMNPDEIQETLDQIPGIAPVKPHKPVMRDAERESRPASGKMWIVLLILAILAGGAYYMWTQGQLDFLEDLWKSNPPEKSELQSADSWLAARDAEKAKEQPVARIPEPGDNRAERILPLPGKQPVLVSPPVETVTPAPPAEDHVTEPETESAPPALASASEEEQKENETQPNGQHKLIITAVEECWIHSNADKSDTRQFSLRKGDTFALTFADSLELKLGNAGGVRLRYDGSDLPPPGSSGQVRTLSFPPKSNS